MNTRSNFSFPLPVRKITNQTFSEQLAHDNPLAIEAARPLFAAGLRIAAITERLSYHADSAPDSMPRHVHTFTLLLQGDLTMIIDNESRAISPGQLVYTPPLLAVYRKGTRGGQLWFLYIELFDVPQWEGLKARGSWIRKYEYADQMFLLLRRILDSHRTRENIDLAQANSALLLQLLRHESGAQSDLPHEQSNTISTLAAKMSLQSEIPWDTSHMARDLNMSRATLTRLFQAEYGVPPKAFVIKQRIARAMELLRETDHTIENIAHTIGYDSPPTFSNLFRKQTGLRPGVFRSKYSSK